MTWRKRARRRPRHTALGESHCEQAPAGVAPPGRVARQVDRVDREYVEEPSSQTQAPLTVCVSALQALRSSLDGAGIRDDALMATCAPYRRLVYEMTEFCGTQADALCSLADLRTFFILRGVLVEALRLPDVKAQADMMAGALRWFEQHRQGGESGAVAGRALGRLAGNRFRDYSDHMIEVGASWPGQAPHMSADGGRTAINAAPAAGRRHPGPGRVARGQDELDARPRRRGAACRVAIRAQAGVARVVGGDSRRRPPRPPVHHEDGAVPVARRHLAAEARARGERRPAPAAHARPAPALGRASRSR